MITNLVILNNRNFFPTVLEARSLKSRCQQAMLPLKALREDSSLPLHASDSSRWSLTCGCIHPQYLPLSLHSLLLCVSVSTLLFLSKDTVIGFKAHPKPVWSHLEILNLFVSPKILFPKEVTFTAAGIKHLDLSFWRGHYPTHYRVQKHPCPGPGVSKCGPLTTCIRTTWYLSWKYRFLETSQTF